MRDEQPQELQTGERRLRGKRRHPGRLLRPDPIGATQQTVNWPDPLRGPWAVTIEWADVDGRAVPVGITARSYDLHDDGERVSVRPDDRHPDQPATVTRDLFKRLPVAALVEQSRQAADGWAGFIAEAHNMPERDAEQAARYADAVTGSRKPPRARGRTRSPDFYAEVARLYREAIAQGGDPARKPAKYVRERLRDPERWDGRPSPEMVRQFIFQARRDGLIPPATTTKETKQ